MNDEAETWLSEKLKLSDELPDAYWTLLSMHNLLASHLTDLTFSTSMLVEKTNDLTFFMINLQKIISDAQSKIEEATKNKLKKRTKNVRRQKI